MCLIFWRRPVQVASTRETVGVFLQRFLLLHQRRKFNLHLPDSRDPRPELFWGGHLLPDSFWHTRYAHGGVIE